MTEEPHVVGPLTDSKVYRAPLVVLHWLLTVLIFGMLALGFLVLAPMANADPAKIDLLRWHMVGGIASLATLIVFLGLRWWLGAPARLTAGSPSLDQLAIVIHRGFYVVIGLIALTGIATSAIVGLPDIVFAGSGKPLPSTFHGFPSLAAHALLAILMVGMILLHTAGVLFHQLVRQDRLMRRMGIGKPAKPGSLA